jgi:hypothetical protein
LHIWANSDVRLAGVSLDLIETGGVIKFTGLHVPNPVGPPPRWVLLDGPQVINNSSVTNIGGAAIPGIVGDGIGAGTSRPANGANVLIASVNYMVTSFGFSNLRLRVGNNGIADFNGNFAEVRFGTHNAPLVNGDDFGASGLVGTLDTCCIEAPLIPVDANLGDRPRGSIVDHTFTVSSSAGSVTWSNLVVNGPGTPTSAPSLSADGRFLWNSANSPLGTWNFDARVTDQFGSAVGHLTVNLVVPEPGAALLAGLAAIACVALSRRDPISEPATTTLAVFGLFSFAGPIRRR